MKKLLNLICFLSLSTGIAQAVISGKIMDGEFNDPLPFANILVVNAGLSPQGTSTDFDGNYSLELAPGNYDVEISFVGYDTQIITAVTAVEGEEVVLNTTLLPSSNALEEVIVTTTVRQNSEAAVLSIQKRSVNLIDGLSSQSIKKSGDSNLATAIKRVPGVSIQGGKFVYVRGLGDRYSKTLLNGLEVPGLDPDKNTLQLDIFPTNLLENIIVSKSASADLNADFTGGIVDVVLKDFSVLPEYSLTVRGGVNPNMNFKEIVRVPQESLNAFGFDNGYTRLPIVANQEIPVPETFLDPALANVVGKITNAFTKQMEVSRAQSSMDYSFGVSTSNQIKIGATKSIGFIAAIGYKYDVDYYENYRTGTIVKFASGLQENTAQNGELGTINAIASGLFGLSYKTLSSKYKLNLLTIKNGESNAISAIYEDFIENPYLGEASIMTHTDRTIISVPLSGKHSFNANKFTIDWKIAPSFARVYDKDFKKTVFERSGDVLLFNAATTQLPSRLWRTLEEDALSGNTLFTYTFDFNGFQSKVKTGFSFTSKDRSFQTSNYDIEFRGRSSSLNGDANAILADANIWTLANNRGSYIQGSYQRTNQYNSKSETVAGFISAEWKLSEKWKSILGVRYEGFQLFYSGENIERTVFNNAQFINVNDLYPSLNVINSVNENSNIRFSFSKTTARPSFKESSAAQLFDPITERYFLGNPELQPTYINNFDLRYERFGTGNEIYAVSAFYKTFKDPIEIVAYSVNSPFVLIGRNNENAKVYGAEFEVRKDLLTSENQRLSFNLNASLIYSSQKMNATEFQSRSDAEPDRQIDPYRQLQGQSPYLINAGILYTHEKYEAGLFYNVQGSALEVVGVGNIPDVYTAPFHNLNANFSKKFGANDNQSLSLKMDNLLDDDRESRYEYFGDQSNVFSFYRPRRSFSLGYTLKF